MTKLEKNLISLAEQVLLETTSCTKDNYTTDAALELAKSMDMSVDELLKFDISNTSQRCFAMCEIAEIQDSGLSDKGINSLNNIKSKLIKFVNCNRD